jgi:hypothetical protein
MIDSKRGAFYTPHYTLRTLRTVPGRGSQKRGRTYRKDKKKDIDYSDISRPR